MSLNCKPCLNDNHDQCTHKNCLCEIETRHNAKTKLRGKKYWGFTEIEKEFTDYLVKHYDEMLHNLIASCKVGKICLIKNKWQFLYPIGNSYNMRMVE